MRADILSEVLTAQVWKSSFPAYECPVCCADGVEWVCRGNCPDATWTSCSFEEGSHGVSHNVVQEERLERSMDAMCLHWCSLGKLNAAGSLRHSKWEITSTYPRSIFRRSAYLPSETESVVVSLQVSIGTSRTGCISDSGQNP